VSTRRKLGWISILYFAEGFPFGIVVDNLPVLVAAIGQQDRVPNAGLQADGIELDTLGLFTGAEFADEGAMVLPPQIILFLENIWSVAETSEKRSCDEVRTTFLHELGHYLGLDEDDLTERGLE
jgi:predicted Zn-dependent protease with MMP-like domain